MNMKNKLYIGCFTLALAAYSGIASANDAVLFKIHDITPVKNADGVVVSCDLGATFYNRSKSEVYNTALKLEWADEVVADAINQEERNAKEAKRMNRRNIPRYNTATYNSRNVSLNLRLPTIKPYQQVTLKSKVNTDRCFLLFNDMDIEVTSCNLLADKADNKSSSAKDACKNLFRFIGPKSPEYHMEFKAVSEEEQKTQEDMQMDAQKKEIEKVYGDTVSSISAFSKRLANSMPGMDGGPKE
ncbi:MAG: hypothetical protein E7019_06550 [Alphaproteobacteria bacterium]|nr:hypothetical protein [Alphaproteobacteria bacterium]